MYRNGVWKVSMIFITQNVTIKNFLVEDSLTYNGDIDLSICDHRLIAKSYFAIMRALQLIIMCYNCFENYTTSWKTKHPIDWKWSYLN